MNTTAKTLPKSSQESQIPVEMPLKRFCAEIALRTGLSFTGAYERFRSGNFRSISVERKNRRVVTVKLIKPLDELALESNQQLESKATLPLKDYSRRPGELLQSEWLAIRAQELAIKPSALLMRIVRGREPMPPSRKVGHWKYIQAT